MTTAAQGAEDNLPAPVDRLVGREAALAELRVRLCRSRLVTLVGPGGAGKTRLAVELAPRVRDAYRDGVCLVELAPLTQDTLVAQTIAAALGLREAPGRPLPETLVAELAGRQKLLLLDTCEHVAGAVAALTRTLLRSCPDLTVLATSREALQVPGESVFRVPELSLPDPAGGGEPARLLRSDAVRLFLDRATTTNPDFELGAADTAAVAAICVRLGGNPMAVELAAGRARVLSAREILDRLDARFRLLANGSRTGPERHRDLRATIDWSYQLLPAAEQVVFRRLSALPGGFTVQLATAVCADAQVPGRDIPNVLTSLETKSLIRLARRDGAGTRFRQPESLRLYAYDQLVAAGEEEAAHARLVDYLTPYCEIRFDQFTPDVFRVLSDERDNLLAAVGWTNRRGDHRQLVLASGLARCWRCAGYHRQAYGLLREVLARTDPAAERRAAVLLQAAAELVILRRCAEGFALAEEALALARAGRQLRTVAAALNVLALLHSHDGAAESAYAYGREALELIRPVGTPIEVAVALNNVAAAALDLGMLTEAAALLADCVPIIRTSQAAWLRAPALHTSGVLALHQDDLDAAEAWFREALEPAAEREPGTAAALEGLGVVAARRSDPEQALRLIAGAAHLLREWDQPSERRWAAHVQAAAEDARRRLGRRRSRSVEAAAGRVTLDELVRYASAGPTPTEADMRF
jgi:predicted ATPase